MHMHVAHVQELWLIGCNHTVLPEFLTLHYSGCDHSVSEVPEVLAATEQPCYSHNKDRQQASPPLTGTCQHSANDSDPTLHTAPSDDISKQMNVQSAYLEAALSADTASVTDIFSPAVLVAAESEPHDTLYHLICRRLQSIDNVDERRRLCESLTVLLQFFEAECLSADPSCSGSSPAFPFHLLDQYTKLIKDDVSFYSADG